MQPDAQESRFYDKLGIEPPTSVSHGVRDEDTRGRLLPANPRDWRLEGNVLHCMTDHGPVAQTIPTDYIMRGIGEDGLPVLTKIAL